MQVGIPTSTVATASSWTKVPGTGEATHEDLDEGVDGSDLGATYVFQTNGSAIDVGNGLRDSFRVGVTVRDPGIDTDHRVRVVSRKTGGAWPSGLAGKVELLEGSTVRWSSTIPANADWLEDAWDLTEGQAAAIGNYAALSLRVQTGAQGTYQFRVSALQLEVPIVFPPVELFAEVQPPELEVGAGAPILQPRITIEPGNAARLLCAVPLGVCLLIEPELVAEG